MPSHIIAIFEVAFRRSRRITDDELRHDQLSWFREKLREASEWLPERDKGRLLKAYADSFTDADYRPLALCHDVPELIAAIRATPVGKVLTAVSCGRRARHSRTEARQALWHTSFYSAIRFSTI
jgi:hypothetical protein